MTIGAFVGVAAITETGANSSIKQNVTSIVMSFLFIFFPPSPLNFDTATLI